MSLGTGKRLSRARYAVDFAVHALHVLILEPAFREVGETEAWVEVFCTFPGFKGEAAYLRKVAALRALVTVEASADLDVEVAKVKAAFQVAYKLMKADAKAKTNAARTRQQGKIKTR